MTKILYDTDIGSDIDDAVCLAYLLAQPLCDLLGVTTVSGEPVNRAMLASAQCKVAGKSVPIYPGSAEPLLISSLQPTASQVAALSRWDHETDFPVGEAVEFLRRTIRSHPREVTLLATGPMTNIALLFKADPEIPSLLKSFVMMGGVFDGQKVDRLSSQGNAEWNIRCDPHAADIVYRANVAVHRSIGLDVTTHVTMEAPEVRERFQNRRLLRPVLDFAEVWFNQSAPGYKSPERIIFHDPLAATTIFNDDICRFDRGNVKVELYDPEEVAVTRWTPRPDGGHEIAMDVNAGRFFDEYFGVFAEH